MPGEPRPDALHRTPPLVTEPTPRPAAAPEHRRAGLRGRHTTEHAPTLHVHHFQDAFGRAPAPRSADVSGGITSWGMLGNDELRDCGPAATAHARMLKAVIEPGTTAAPPRFEASFVQPTTEAVTAQYFAYGIAQGQPGPNPDHGVNNARWLAWLFSQGLIEAYAEIDLTGPDARARVRRAMVDFGGVLLGIGLTSDAEQCFESHEPWTLEHGHPSNPGNGHDVLLVAYDDAGDTLVTWGALQRSTIPFDHACFEEAWVIVTSEDAARSGFDLEGARAAIAEHIDGLSTPTAPPS